MKNKYKGNLSVISATLYANAYLDKSSLIINIIYKAQEAQLAERNSEDV